MQHSEDIGFGICMLKVLFKKGGNLNINGIARWILGIGEVGVHDLSFQPPVFSVFSLVDNVPGCWVFNKALAQSLSAHHRVIPVGSAVSGGIAPRARRCVPKSFEVRSFHSQTSRWRVWIINGNGFFR